MLIFLAFFVSRNGQYFKTGANSPCFKRLEKIREVKTNVKVGLFSATILVVANMVGTGIFTTSGFIIKKFGNPQTMLLCWAAGGIFALCGAVCYGELGAMW